MASVLSSLPWLADFVDLEPFSAAYKTAERSLGHLRLRLGIATELTDGAGLICEVPIGRYRPSPGTLPPGTVLRFDRMSHGCEDPCSWQGPPAPVFAVEGGSSDGYLVGFYLGWLRPGAAEEAAAIEPLADVRDRQ
jgi:hypothetical protein